MEVHACNPSTWVGRFEVQGQPLLLETLSQKKKLGVLAQAGRPQDQGFPGLQCEFKAILGS